MKLEGNITLNGAVIRFNAIRPAEGIETNNFWKFSINTLRFNAIRPAEGIETNSNLDSISEIASFNAIRPAEGIETILRRWLGKKSKRLQRDSTR